MSSLNEINIRKLNTNLMNSIVPSAFKYTLNVH